MFDHRSKIHALRKTAIGTSIFFSLLISTSACTMQKADSDTNPGPKRESQSTKPDGTQGAIDTAALADFIEKTRIETKVTGVSVILVKGDQTLMARGFGMADVEAGIPVTEKTLFRIGSVSKQFTSLGFMQLVEQKRADLDAPITRYVPELKIHGNADDLAGVTARRIMTHHSGLPGNVLKGMWSTTPISFSEQIALSNDAYLAQKPDLVHSYSNLGLLVLGRAIENLSAEDFTRHMDKTIFEPLSMNHTSYRQTPAMTPYLAKGYMNGTAVTEAPIQVLPAGSMFSSAEDLGQFIKMILAGGKSGGQQVISQQSLAEMMRVQNADIALDLGQKVGLGWNINSFPVKGVGRVLHHGGGTPLFRSMLVTLPDLGYGFAILTNSTSGELVLEAATMKILEALAKTPEAQAYQKTAPAPEPAAPDTLKRLACDGYYTVENKGYAKATPNGSALNLRWKGRDYSFTRDDKGDYVFSGPADGRFTYGERVFCTEISGHAVMLGKSGDRLALVGEHFEPVKIPASWQARAGAYDIANGDGEMPLYTNFNLGVEDGVLMLRYSMPFFEDHDGPAVLKPLSDTQAIVLGLGRNTGDVITVKTGKDGEQLYYAGYFLKKKR